VLCDKEGGRAGSRCGAWRGTRRGAWNEMKACYGHKI
jgi:hypothetical protein